MPEYSVTLPLWDSRGLVDVDFPISSDLKGRLIDWQVRWEELQVVPQTSSHVRAVEVEDRLVAHTSEGYSLVDKLQEQLGSQYEVVYRP